MNINRPKAHGKLSCDDVEAMYSKIVMVALSCDPIPASQRVGNQLEPPWEVFARVKRERDALRAENKRLREALADACIFMRQAVEQGVLDRDEMALTLPEYESALAHKGE